MQELFPNKTWHDCSGKTTTATFVCIVPSKICIVPQFWASDTHETRREGCSASLNICLLPQFWESDTHEMIGFAHPGKKCTGLEFWAQHARNEEMVAKSKDLSGWPPWKNQRRLAEIFEEGRRRLLLKTVLEDFFEEFLGRVLLKTEFLRTLLLKGVLRECWEHVLGKILSKTVSEF